jgi:hypothetical protein
MCDQGAVPCPPHSLPQTTQTACRHGGYNPSPVVCSVWPSRVLLGCDFLPREHSRGQMRAATADRRVESSPRTGGAVCESRAMISGHHKQLPRVAATLKANLLHHFLILMLIFQLSVRKIRHTFLTKKIQINMLHYNIHVI